MEIEDIKNKKIGIFLNYVACSPATELFMSFIDVALKNNNEIIVYYCDSNLSGCSFNPIKSKVLCNLCKKNVYHIKNKFENNLVIKKIDLGLIDNEPYNELNKMEFDMAAMSSIASLTKAINDKELSDYWTKKLKEFKEDSQKLFIFFKFAIDKEKLEFLTCFNGRFFDAKPIIMSARTKNINFILLEVKKSENPVAFVNELIHSINGNCSRAHKYYDKNPKLGNNLGNEFFKKKISQEKTGDPIYTIRQKQGLLPKYIELNSKPLIVIYPTTDDEYKFIGKEWDGHVPEDQVNEIRVICEILKNFLIVVKMHPNQKFMTNMSLINYYKLEKDFSNCKVEKPDSKYDTYEFLKKAQYIITFASTICIEAAYLKKKVINIGDANFSKMNATTLSKNGFQASQLILNKKVPKGNKLAAIKWGYYLYKYKSKLTKFSRNSNGQYFYDNEKLPSHKLLYFFGLFSKLIIRFKKRNSFNLL